MGREHDRPDPTLIISGSRRPHPSKRIQGLDYPETLLKESEIRKPEKGTYEIG
jgi:hypothetical protein